MHFFYFFLIFQKNMYVSDDEVFKSVISMGAKKTQKNTDDKMDSLEPLYDWIFDFVMDSIKLPQSDG